LGLLQ
jgi:hypothetical protein